MNIEDFVRMTDAYFENPRLDSAGRQNILRQQFNQIDGQAGRTAELLRTLAVRRR